MNSYASWWMVGMELNGRGTVCWPLMRLLLVLLHRHREMKKTRFAATINSKSPATLSHVPLGQIDVSHELGHIFEGHGSHFEGSTWYRMSRLPIAKQQSTKDSRTTNYSYTID